MQEIELLPELQLGFLNGWIPLIIFYIILGSVFIFFPRDVVKRLWEFDRSSWKRGQRISFALGKILALVIILLIVLTPLRMWSFTFLIGVLFFAPGLVLFGYTLLCYKNTPLENPVAIGTYRYSRHPQLVTMRFVLFGISLMIGSGIVMLLLFLSWILQHPGVVAEESECLRRFGQSYKEYLDSTPRYLFI